MINKGIKLNEKEKILNLLKKINIEFEIKDNKDVVLLNGENVTKRIRQSDVSKLVSYVSSIKEVRFKLNEIFRKCAENKNVIMEGRDITTYVFPNADIKIYLDATKEERAKRRFKQNQESNILDMTYEEVLKNIEMRDKNDKEKEIGALKIADDAIYIDSTNLSIEDVTEKIVQIIKNKLKKYC